MIEPDATRIFVIKGGPGVGKSTFMRRIGEAMLEQGYEVEFHCCSSDNNSLDGVVIPALRIALLDGTAPHGVDPKNPGAVDEIIHLGDHWQEDMLRANKTAIMESNARVGRLFVIAYQALAEAKIVLDEWESYLQESQNFPQVNRLTLKLEEEIFADIKPQFIRPAKIRRLFASAITPLGPVNSWDTLLIGVDKIFVLQGDPGTGKSTLIERLLTRAQLLGLDCQAYHCSFDPTKLDGIIIPALKVAVINGNIPSDLQLPATATIYNLNDYLNRQRLSLYTTEIDSVKGRFWTSFYRAVKYIKEAKAEHDRMETYYIPAMDFTAINQRREEILNRILQYAEETKN
ncbi:hypothetical protein JDF658_27090 [Carboxydocella sp. JDF658]|nr:hypothetical protein JDF658_27090 [Carboxydocella sp. JDF658]